MAKVLKKLSSRNILTGSLGNLLEWYDFSLYGYFAATIGTLFFPREKDLSSLLLAYTVFAVGLFMRPLGGLILGHFGDMIGRRMAMIISIIVITLPTFCMGLLPTYLQIGIGASILLIFLRILQGLSVGGEFIGTTIFLVEHAPNQKRGLGGSFAYMGQTGGMLGSSIAVFLTNFLPENEFLKWGWRVPFLIGILVGGAGFYMRKKVFETPPFCKLLKTGQISKAPLTEVFSQHWKEALTVFGLVQFQAISFYLLLLYLVTWMPSVVGMAQTHAYTLNIIGMVIFTVLMPIIGKWSDRVGRRPFLLTSSLLMLLLAWPLFWLLKNAAASIHPLLYGLPSIICFACLLACWHGPLACVLVEITPLKNRYSTLAVGYNFSAALFGGTAPLVATFLVLKTLNPIAPCFYLMLAALAAFFVVLFAVKETYHCPIDEIV